tara:strand:+ start:876 stop:1631 length:756 start_codon:yes stop_codon:yes gene_type:complete
MINLYKGDCLEVMQQILNGSVDAIITDPPYGTTTCKWDSVIDFNLMWKQLNRIIKPNGAIVLFGSEPFSSALRMSNIKNYKYDWIWDKGRGSNFATVKYQPFKEHEIISVFNKHNYYPIKILRTEKSLKRYNDVASWESKGEHTTTGIKRAKNNLTKLRNPKSIIKFNIGEEKRDGKNNHPTKKPVALMEYLIKTYTKENETVLDFTMGSGTTGVAAKNLNRKFIGIEQDDNYFNIATDRINKVEPQTELF